jgi:hypothetical protein
VNNSLSENKLARIVFNKGIETSFPKIFVPFVFPLVSFVVKTEYIAAKDGKINHKGHKG